MAESVHMITTGSSGGSRRTSTAETLTEAGYQILKIIEEFGNKSEFDISSVKANIDGITKKYHSAHRDKTEDTSKQIVQAEVNAFINLGLVHENDSAHDIFKKTPQGEFSLTDKAKERMAEHEASIAAEAAEAERLAQLQPEDPLKLEDMHFSLLEATQFYVQAKPPHGSTQIYIVKQVIGENNKPLRDEANKAFRSLQEQGCFETYQRFTHNATRYRLSKHGKKILDDRPSKFPVRTNG
ncbi:MAG: hypothetical protein AAF244_03265 [Pseudomonadota bacterium]